MKGREKDVKELETCRNDHIHQYVESDNSGTVWQYCLGCDRKLWVR